MEIAKKFNLKALEPLCADPNKWIPQPDFGWLMYEARIGDFSIAIWKQRNEYRIPVINKYTERPTFHMEIYRDTGRTLERHIIAKANGSEVRALYEHIVAAKEHTNTNPIKRVQEREPEYLLELEGILGSREKAA